MKKLIFTLFAVLFVISINAQTTKSSKSTSSKNASSKATTSRSAKSGQYVTKSYADKHKSTTYTSKKKR